MRKRTRNVDPSLARRVAAHAGGDAGRVPLSDHPQGRKLLGAFARAERIREHLDGVLFLASRGVGDATELARLRAFAREADAMWLALVKKRSLGHEIAMRFLDALEFACRRYRDEAPRLAHARDVLAARLPDLEVRREVFVEGLTAWSSKRRDWRALHRIVRRGVTSEVPRSAGALRVQYSRWRESLGLTGRPSLPA